MSNQKEIRTRIASTISTQQITKAMKLVSATKLRKATDAIVRMRPYALKLQGILANLQDSVDDDRLAVYFKEREVNKVLIILVASDRGLCGAFNSNVVKRAKAVAESKYAKQLAAGKVDFLCIGKKGAEAMRRYRFNVNDQFLFYSQDLSAEKSFEIGEYALNAFRSGAYDRVELVFNQFKNAATQIVTNEVLLPVVQSQVTTNKKAPSNDYIFEPGKVEILQDLIPRSLKTQIYRAQLDSLASEHGARMVSMDKATENAGDLLRSLRLAYNQARQAAITREISEIVGGVAALEG